MTSQHQRNQFTAQESSFLQESMSEYLTLKALTNQHGRYDPFFERVINDFCHTFPSRLAQRASPETKEVVEKVTQTSSLIVLC